MTGRAFVATTSIVLLAAAVRVPGLFTDFWLDEIWALLPVPGLKSATEVFTGIHHSVNHYLLTLWMYLVGVERDFWIFRLPSFVAGLAGVGAAGALARTERSNPWLAMTLTSLSAPLVIYSSEARGYAIAVSSAVVALVCLLRWLARPRFGWLAAYWLAMCVGLLGHLSYVFVFAPTSAVLLTLMLRDRLTPERVAAAQAVPLAFLAWLFFVDLRFFQSGGGEARSLVDVVVQAASLGFGGPMRGWGVWLCAAACGAVLVIELRRRFRQWRQHADGSEIGLALAVFYVSAFLLPVGAVVLTQQTHFYPRYLLVSLVFVPVLVASWAESIAPRWGRLVLAAFLVVNLASLAQFARNGRGAYAEALALMQRSSNSQRVTIASDRPLTRMVVEFYAPRLGDVSRVQYLEDGADFWIASSPAAACAPCDLLGAFPASEVSGTDWYVYKRH